MITIGIDPHKGTVTAVAVQDSGAQLGTIRLPVTTKLQDQLLRFAVDWTDRRWAVEGATGLGLGVAQNLAAAGETVLDVPAKLAARARLLATGHGRKTDALDAVSVAAVAQRNTGLRTVVAEDDTVPLRLLSDHRDDLVSERTRVLNRLHRLLRELVPGGANRQLSSIQAGEILRTVRPVTTADTYRKQLARDLLDSLRRLDGRVRALTDQIAELVEERGTKLTEIRGVGPVVAAKIIGHSGDIRRFPDRNHYASYTGTAPLTPPAASRTGTDSAAWVTGSSTPRSTSSPSAKAADPAPDRTSTGASSPSTRHPTRPAEPSNDGCPTSSTASWSKIEKHHNQPGLDTQRRYEVVCHAGDVATPSGQRPTDPFPGQPLASIELQTAPG